MGRLWSRVTGQDEGTTGGEVTDTNSLHVTMQGVGATSKKGPQSQGAAVVGRTPQEVGTAVQGGLQALANETEVPDTAAQAATAAGELYTLLHGDE